MLKVDVDVRRFCALFRQKALEKQVHTVGINLGHAQGVTNRGVGSGATPLAKNAATAGEADDVFDGEEVMFVLEFCDQGQLFLDQHHDPLRSACGITHLQTFERERTQMLCGRQPGWHDLAGVAVAQLIKPEGAALGDRHRFGE